MDKKEISILDHLLELRKRLIALLIFLVFTYLVGFVFAADIYRLLTSQLDQPLVVLGPNDILWIYLTLAGISSFGLTLPFLTYQIWAYVRPALEWKEARFFLIYIPAVFLCFVLGFAFGFFIVTPALLEVLLSLGEGLFVTQMTAQNYIEFVLHTTIPIAILFELPIFIAFLTAIGVVRTKFLRHYRRYAYFALIVLSVLLTPADLMSDLALSVPLLLIYEVSILLSQMIEKRRRK